MEQTDYFAIEQTVASRVRAESFVKIKNLEDGLIADPEDFDLDCAGSLDCPGIAILNE
jgi:hypothetical protein